MNPSIRGNIASALLKASLALALVAPVLALDMEAGWGAPPAAGSDAMAMAAVINADALAELVVPRFGATILATDASREAPDRADGLRP